MLRRLCSVTTIAAVASSPVATMEEVVFAVASVVAVLPPGNDPVVLDNEDATVQPGPRRLPSPTVMDFGDEPRVRLWEGEA